MNKVTIISGPPFSGKTKLAKQLTECRKAVFITSKDLKLPFNCISEDTEVIVIDEVSTQKKSMEKLKILVTTENFTLRKKYKSDIVIKRPELIITSNKSLKDDFHNRAYVNFYSLTI